MTTYMVDSAELGRPLSSPRRDNDRDLYLLTYKNMHLYLTGRAGKDIQGVGNGRMEIIPLHRVPDYAPILAHWSYTEWYRTRSMDFSLVLRAYQERARSDRVPLSFVAIEGSLPAGMVTLKRDDLWSRKDLNPWLASLYVMPEYRRGGMGQALIRAVTTRAAELGYDRLYLFLGHHDRGWLEGYYLNRGWVVVEPAVDNDGLETKILAYGLPL